MSAYVIFKSWLGLTCRHEDRSCVLRQLEVRQIRRKLHPNLWIIAGFLRQRLGQGLGGHDGVLCDIGNSSASIYNISDVS